MKSLYTKVVEFMNTNPNQNEIELFYVNEILNKTKLSINEILELY